MQSRDNPSGLAVAQMSALHNDAIVESGLSADGLLDLRSGDYANMCETHKKVDLAYSKNHEELRRGDYFGSPRCSDSDCGRGSS